MKHIIILLACLSATTLWAQRSIKIEALPSCPMTLYNQDSTSLEQIGPSFKTRKAETIVVEYLCDDAEANKILNGASFYLVITDINGMALTDTETSVTIDGINIPTYAQAIYRSEKGLRFEVNPISWSWQKGTVASFSIFSQEGEVRRKNLLFN
ncbi:MAG: hypothetical protein AB8H47_16800 [Bacteroidia bacterium]